MARNWCDVVLDFLFPCLLPLSITRFFLIAIYRRFYLHFLSARFVCLSVYMFPLSITTLLVFPSSVFLAISGYPIVLRSNYPFFLYMHFLSLSRTYNGYQLLSTTYLRRFFFAIYRFDHLLRRPQRPFKSTNFVISAVTCLPYRLLLPWLPTTIFQALPSPSTAQKVD